MPGYVREHRTQAAQTTTDSYTTLAFGNVDGNEFSTLGDAGSFSAIVRETGSTNGIDAKVQVSNDGTNWIDHPDASLVDVAIAAGGAAAFRDSEAIFAHYRVQVKASAAGSQGDVEGSVVIK